jgi:hypothetical protein
MARPRWLDNYKGRVQLGSLPDLTHPIAMTLIRPPLANCRSVLAFPALAHNRSNRPCHLLLVLMLLLHPAIGPPLLVLTPLPLMTESSSTMRCALDQAVMARQGG